VSELVTLDEGSMADIRRRVAALIDEGRLVVVPTDTMYGVIGNPFHPQGTDRLYLARAAQRSSPLPVIVHNPRQLPAFAEVGETAERLMASFWPGPLTLLLRAEESMAWDLGDSQGAVAVRMPAEPLLLQVLHDTGPLACTAATRAGEPPPATVEEALASLGDDVALYVDGGVRPVTPSTIVDASRGGAEVRRMGVISADEVFAVANGLVEPGSRPERPEATGAEPAPQDEQDEQEDR
jgi:L-threonylcarbamoyladenylate synthase